MLSAVSGRPVRASSAAVASIVAPPTPVSAIPAGVTEPPSVSIATATPTVAKSPTRRSSSIPTRWGAPRAGMTPRPRSRHARARLERAEDELGGRDAAPPGRPVRDDRAAQRQHHRGPVTLRVGVTQRADQRPAVADERVGNQRGGRCHRRLRPPSSSECSRSACRTGRRRGRCRRRDVVVVQAGDGVDVDEQLRRGEPEFIIGSGSGRRAAPSPRPRRRAAAGLPIQERAASYRTETGTYGAPALR